MEKKVKARHCAGSSVRENGHDRHENHIFDNQSTSELNADERAIEKYVNGVDQC